MPELTLLAWSLLAVSAVLVGISKTALPGANTISIAIFAALLPARESTGALLLLLIVADAFAIWAYRKHADWSVLRRLVPTVLAGLLLGAAFLAVADDAEVRRVIGVILLLVIGITLWRRWAAGRGGSRAPAAADPVRSDTAPRPSASEPELPGAEPELPGAGPELPSAELGTSATQSGPPGVEPGPPGVEPGPPGVEPSPPGAEPAPPTRNARRAQAAIYGTLGGFTTMVANAAGPVMSMYFLASRFSMKTFLGTAAWFFAVVNLVKLPFSVGLGLITGPTLLMDLALVPAVVLGALTGRWLVSRMNQTLFERLVIVLTIGGAGYLLF